MIVQDTRKTRASVDIKATVAHLQDITFSHGLQQSTAFISACYGIHNTTSMTASRIKVWMMKTG